MLAEAADEEEEVRTLFADMSASLGSPELHYLAHTKVSGEAPVLMSDERMCWCCRRARSTRQIPRTRRTRGSC